MTIGFGRIVIAGVIGAVVMFIWSAATHMSPLGMVGITPLPAGGGAPAALTDSTGARQGLYLSPGPNDDYAARAKTEPQIFAMYQPAGSPIMTAAQPAAEFLAELVQAIILAGVLSLAAGFAARVMIAALVGVAAMLSTHGSYAIWYEFPADYTLANMAIILVGYTLAGAAIAWWLGRRRKV